MSLSVWIFGHICKFEVIKQQLDWSSFIPDECKHSITLFMKDDKECADYNTNFRKLQNQKTN